MDKILGRFVLIIVLYVNAERFLLPPIYEARGSTFDGISTGRAIINVLKTHLGDDIAKLRVMMVDGCPVNGVAVRYVNAALADVVTNRITSDPANDWESVTSGLLQGAPIITQLCTGHLIHQICAKAFKKYDQ
eukprot:PhM_4_TR13896/c0_g2_i4/m.5467